MRAIAAAVADQKGGPKTTAAITPAHGSALWDRSAPLADTPKPAIPKTGHSGMGMCVPWGKARWTDPRRSRFGDDRMPVGPRMHLSGGGHSVRVAYVLVPCPPAPESARLPVVIAASNGFSPPFPACAARRPFKRRKAVHLRISAVRE